MPKLDMVMVKTQLRKRVRVMCFDVEGFAVHPALQDEMRWLVTHKPTGIAMPLEFATREKASQFAEKLAGLNLDWDFDGDRTMPEFTREAMSSLVREMKSEVEPLEAA